MIDQDLKEYKVPISDSLCKEYLSLLSTLPPHDHISSQKQYKTTSVFDWIFDLFFYKAPKIDTSNIFIPTVILNLFNHINQVFPDSHTIMADFDEFKVWG